MTESLANFRALLGRLPEGVVVHRDGRVLFANPEFLHMVGREREEDLLGRSIIELVHPDDRDWLAGRIATKDRPPTPTRPHRLLRRDGPPIIIEVHALPIMFEGDLAFVAICQDVTERTRMVERLATAERLASLGRLASGVGHEINNPLAYMMGSLLLARAELAATADVLSGDRRMRIERHLDTVREGAERVRDIVRDLKSLSASGDDGTGPVDVRHALDVASAMVEHEIRLRARLAKEYGSVPSVWGSERRLVQVFVNLLVNAAQAIPEGDVGGNEIRITTREESGKVVAEIRDTGIGIATQHLPHIFEPFFTTKAKEEATGLGLSISHEIVSTHGGMLAVEPIAPRGSLFRVTLPASTETAGKGPPQPPKPSGAPRARLLVVDDEPATARILSELLANHDVAIATSGREAIARLDADPGFDVVVCDLQMNDGSGVDVYEHLRACAPRLAGRMIFMTGGAFTDRALEFLRTCSQPVLDKPFDHARLENLIAEMARSEEP